MQRGVGAWCNAVCLPASTSQPSPLFKAMWVGGGGAPNTPAHAPFSSTFPVLLHFPLQNPMFQSRKQEEGGRQQPGPPPHSQSIAFGPGPLWPLDTLHCPTQCSISQRAQPGLLRQGQPRHKSSQGSPPGCSLAKDEGAEQQGQVEEGSRARAPLTLLSPAFWPPLSAMVLFFPVQGAGGAALGPDLLPGEAAWR